MYAIPSQQVCGAALNEKNQDAHFLRHCLAAHAHYNLEQRTASDQQFETDACLTCTDRQAAVLGALSTARKRGATLNQRPRPEYLLGHPAGAKTPSGQDRHRRLLLHRVLESVWGQRSALELCTASDEVDDVRAALPLTGRGHLQHRGHQARTES